nr:uncharacterized protein LOC111422125 [Onthophagus taurus]
MPRGKYNKVSAADRRRIMKAYEDGKNWRQTAQDLGVNVRTAYEWLKNDQEDPKPKGGSKSKKTLAIDEALVRWIEEDSTLTLKDLSNRVHNEFELRVSINTIKNWLDGKLFSLKKIRPHVANINTYENKVKRREYVEKLLESRGNGRDLIWIDECNFNLYCRRNEGRSKIGHRAHVVVPASKGNNLHCIGAMCSTQIVSFEHKRGSYKGAECKVWFRGLIATCRNLGFLHPSFIIDNAPVHSNLESVLQPQEDVQIIRLAPYSYLLNPIELL